jgi:DtxR family Mn-dependent transcriptional regulator
MIEPFATIAILLLLAGIVWPRHGLAARWSQWRALVRRQRFEDTLKYLHHCEFTGDPVRLESLAGILRVSRDRVVGLIGALEAAGLVESPEGYARLTPSGRREALRVIRSHRLWEKFFAERSGLHETLWHDEADRREHVTSTEQAEQLAASLGYPRFDPHGAPIPTSHGELPSTRGVHLSEMTPGQMGRVVHLEDEPAALHEQLVAQGIALGAVVRVVGREGSSIILEVGGEEQIVAQVAAGNVSVEPLEAPSTDTAGGQRLARVRLQEPARVVGLLPSCRGIQRRRLLDMGLVPGTVVTPELRSAAGDPVAYRVRGALIALRRDQANQIEVEPLATAPPQREEVVANA